MNTVNLDVVDTQKSSQDAERLGLQMTVLSMNGPGGGNPYVKFEGPLEGIETLLREHATDEEDYIFLRTLIDKASTL